MDTNIQWPIFAKRHDSSVRVMPWPGVCAYRYISYFSQRTWANARSDEIYPHSTAIIYIYTPGTWVPLSSYLPENQSCRQCFQLHFWTEHSPSIHLLGLFVKKKKIMAKNRKIYILNNRKNVKRMKTIESYSESWIRERTQDNYLKDHILV